MPQFTEPNNDELQPAPKSKKRSWATYGCLGVIVLFVGAVVVPVFLGARDQGKIIECQSNMRQLGVAMLEYSQDSDNSLPPAKHWADDALIYLPENTTTTPQLFHCPAAKTTPYGYAFNRLIGGGADNPIDNSADADLVMLFESDSRENNAVGSAPDIAWDRHLTGSNIEYADGHVHHVLGSKSQPNMDHAPLRWSN